MHTAGAAAEDVFTPTDRPAGSEDRMMRLTGGSMLTLAHDLRADDRREADARRPFRRPTSTTAAGRPLTMTKAHRPSRRGSTLLAALRRLVPMGQHA
jgi:hypothetical protein